MVHPDPTGAAAALDIGRHAVGLLPAFAKVGGEVGIGAKAGRID